MKRKIIVAIVLLFLLAGGGAAVLWYMVYGNNTHQTGEKGYLLFVSEENTLDDITRELTTAGVMIRPTTFTLLAEKTQSDRLLKPGRYLITDGMSNHQLLQRLRNGLQTPLMFTFNNLNFIEDFCGVAGRVFMFDSTDMVRVVRDLDFLDSLGVRPKMLLGHLLPNTYEFFWTTSPEGVVNRLLQEHERFWRGSRTEKLHARGLDRDEVLILASIIQKETNHIDEMARWREFTSTGFAWG
jgi:UPF0755 protein